MSDMTVEKAQGLLDPFQSRSGTEAMRQLHAAAPDLARAYIAQAAELTRLRAKVGAADKLAGRLRDYFEAAIDYDQVDAALSAYEGEKG